MPCFPNCSGTVASWTGPEHGMISQYTFHFGIKVFKHGGTFTTNRVVSSSNTIPGASQKNCPTSTDVVKPALRET